MPRRRPAGFDDYRDAGRSVERPRRLCIGKVRELGGKLRFWRVEPAPPVAVTVKRDGAGAKNLRNSRGVFSRHAQNHVHQFINLKCLANDGPQTDVLGFIFGIANADRFRKSHAELDVIDRVDNAVLKRRSSPIGVSPFCYLPVILISKAARARGRSESFRQRSCLRASPLLLSPRRPSASSNSRLFPKPRHQWLSSFRHRLPPRANRLR